MQSIVFDVPNVFDVPCNMACILYVYGLYPILVVLLLLCMLCVLTQIPYLYYGISNDNITDQNHETLLLQCFALKLFTGGELSSPKLAALQKVLQSDFCTAVREVYEHVYETVDISGSPEIRANATAKVSSMMDCIGDTNLFFMFVNTNLLHLATTFNEF